MARYKQLALTGLIVVLVTTGCSRSSAHRHGSSTTVPPTTLPKTPLTSAPYQPIPGMPPVLDPNNIYASIKSTDLQPQFAAYPRIVIVPSGNVNLVTIIDATTKRVVNSYRTGRQPQHVVPTYDLTSTWVLDNQGNDAIAIDPITARLGETVRIDDPYNLYFTPDGQHAIVVAEKYRRLDFYSSDLKTRQLSINVSECEGINHGDWSADGRYALFTCEFNGKVAKIDTVGHKVLGYVDVGGMPQDLRAGPNGHTFYVADMMANGVHILDGDNLRKIGFIPTGIGAHGITIARDAQRMYVANRGSSDLPGKAPARGPGSVSIVDFATNAVQRTIVVPEGGSPDMGNLNVEGTELWLSGRFDGEVYVFNVTPGQESFAMRIPVPTGPHGLAYMPQPGRYSLGHTGNTR